MEITSTSPARAAAWPGMARVAAAPHAPGTSWLLPRTRVDGPWVQAATLQDPRLDEVSGAVASASQPGVTWVHNDSGDSARVFAIGADGRTRTEVRLAGRIALDWEDIAMGPGPRGGGGRDWLYVADTGDNAHLRPAVSIYRFPEPRTEPAQQTVDAERIAVRYADGQHHDVEAMLVDPRSGDLLLVVKARAAQTTVFRLTQAQLAAGSAVATPVATIDAGPLVTGGDVSADGSAVALRTYDAVWLWERRPGESLVDAMARAPRRLPGGLPSESIAFDPDGGGLTTIPEGRGAPVLTMRLDAAATAGAAYHPGR